jgi:hypothetical protein
LSTSTHSDTRRPGYAPSIYLGTFLIAAATLALEVTLTRLLSVTTWYHLAFFAVSIAMLGMTAGAVTVYLKPKWFASSRIGSAAGKACLGYALVIPLTLKVLCVAPVDVSLSLRGLLSLFVVSLVSLLPFYFSGAAITAVITRSRLPIGKVYASDLAGASLGCLFVLGGLEVFDAPSLILLCACVGVLAALGFGWQAWARRLRLSSLSLLAILAILVIVNALTSLGIRPEIVKGRRPGTLIAIFEKWNSFSRVVVYEGRATNPQYWAASPKAPKGLMVHQHRMDIDGEAATTLLRFESFEDIVHLRYDVTNVAYYLRPTGGACIIGVGGGRDIQSAILFGHEKVTGVEINPIFIDLLENRFRQFAGIADWDGVTLVADEARSFLSRSRERYSVIQMSLTDTWAATGAGAFSLSENALYTLDAWEIFLNRLSSNGIFTVSRWYGPDDLGETGRIVSLAVATLLKLGSPTPASHMAMVTSGSISTLLVSSKPLSQAEIARLREVCRDLGFRLVMHPGEPPEDPDLKGIVAASSFEKLKDAVADKRLTYDPPTDERPYFFNMISLKQVLPFLWLGSRQARADASGVVGGNIVASRTLVMLILCLVVLSIITVVFPLVLKGRHEKSLRQDRPILWAGAAYFSLIGAGFMFVEIALIQRLSVFLGHPIYALGVLLFTIIASAGLGSFLSERLPLARRPWVFVYPVVIALAVLAVRLILPILSSQTVSASMLVKILASIAAIVPLGLLLGTAFPTGMRLVMFTRSAETPWYWALNGVFGVLCAALTVFISIYSGISMSLYIGAFCYVLILLCIPRILRPGDHAAA